MKLSPVGIERWDLHSGEAGRRGGEEESSKRLLGD